MTNPKAMAGKLGGLKRSEAKRRASVSNCAKARAGKILRKQGVSEEVLVKSGQGLSYNHKSGRGRVVYLVSDGSGAYKIGSCTNIEKRATTLQIGNPRKLQVLRTWRFLNASSVEEALHDKFLDKRVRGEWFELTRGDLSILKSMAHQLKQKELNMPDPTITIPATAEATDAYRLAQSQATMREEKAEPVTFGTNNLKSDLFKRGKPLAPENCLITEPIDGWDPKAFFPLSELIPPSLKERVDREFSAEGLAGFIAISDSTGGVREVIEYDENEVIVKPLIEEDHHDKEE